jgi:ATP-dependent DNA ligase
MAGGNQGESALTRRRLECFSIRSVPWPNRNSFNDDYPVLIDSLKSLKTKSFTIDGEITALDENGRSSFQLLQGYGKAKHTPLVYYAFDLSSLDGADLRSRRFLNIV